MSTTTITAAKADLNDDPRGAQVLATIAVAQQLERIADMLKRGIPVITE